MIGESLYLRYLEYTTPHLLKKMTLRRYGEPLLGKPSYSKVLQQLCTPAAWTHNTPRIHMGPRW